MGAMSHCERFEAMLQHREPDRVPIAFGGPECSIHHVAHKRLLDHLGYQTAAPAPVIDTILQIVELDMRLCRRFDVDVLWLVPKEGPVEWGEGRKTYRDEFGRRFKLEGGFYNQIESPLREGSQEELKRYVFPDMSTHDRAAGLAESARRLVEAGYGLVADGAWGVYEICSSLRGTQELLMDMVLKPDDVQALAERVLEEHLKPFYTMLLEAVGPYVQMVVISDDYGSQQGLLFSPEQFRALFKPLLHRLVEHIKAAADVKVYIHSDGAIRKIIPDFIDIGLDGINPVQYTAEGMAADQLKREFGGELGFFGGGLDNAVLAFGTIEEIRRDVQQQLAVLSPGGGHLFAAIHNISQEVPPENIVAFFEAGREFGSSLAC